MKLVSINTMGDFPEDFLFAKVDVERKLIEDEKIEKRMKLEEFIFYLNLQDNIYLRGNKNISFSIQHGLNDDYIFYTLLDSDIDEKTMKNFSDKLKSVNYNLSRLKKINNYDLLEVDFDKEDVFMIKSEFYK